MAAALSSIDELAVLRFEGADAARFLQGYFTCDIQSLEPDRWTLTALTNLQGRVVASGWIQPSASSAASSTSASLTAPAAPSGLIFLTHSGLAERVLAFLAPYLRLSRTRGSIDRTTTVLTALADGSAAASADGETRMAFSLAPATDASSAGPGFREALNRARIVLVAPSVSEGFLPQALGLVDAGAVSFSKGCYLGQEVVARAQHRGVVKKSLAFCAGTQNLSAAPRDPLQDSTGKKVGTVVQVGFTSALVVVNDELPADTACWIGETPVTVLSN